MTCTGKRGTDDEAFPDRHLHPNGHRTTGTLCQRDRRDKSGAVRETRSTSTGFGAASAGERAGNTGSRWTIEPARSGKKKSSLLALEAGSARAGWKDSLLA
jgi:hypothetical protein